MRTVHYGGNGGRSEMSERRSSRRKRIVNYHQFADKDSDGDDDFESSPVLSKKGRSAEERGQKKASNSPVVSRSKALQQEPEAPSCPPKKARQSRDERQFDKDTDQALRESIATTVCQQSTEPAPSRPGLEEGKDSDYQPLNEEENDDYSSGYDEASDSDFETSGPPAPKKSKPTKTKSVAAQSNGQPGTARARTEAAARKTSGEGRTHPPPKTGIENVSRTRHTTQKAPTIPTLSPAATTATVLPNSSSSKSTTVLPPKSPLPGCHGTPALGKRRLPNWTPPGPAGSRENRTVTSGGTPVIRVGLSRNARVKPLHNKCLAHHNP